ncbi:MAG: hypothetical protein IJ133_02135 [Clostridia bacterium]|nr:hypothetical protein [Clostridia bacterium]
MYQSGTAPYFDGEPDTKSLPTTFDAQGRMVSLVFSAGFQTQPTYQYHYTGTSFFPDRYTVSDTLEDGLLWMADVTCTFSHGHLQSVTSNEHYKEDATVDENFLFLWNYTYEESGPKNSLMEKATLWIQQRLFHRK